MIVVITLVPAIVRCAVPIPAESLGVAVAVAGNGPNGPLRDARHLHNVSVRIMYVCLSVRLPVPLCGPCSNRTGVTTKHHHTEQRW